MKNIHRVVEMLQEAKEQAREIGNFRRFKRAAGRQRQLLTLLERERRWEEERYRERD